MSTTETKIIKSLAAIGYGFESLDDLVNTRSPYPEAIPILVTALKDGIQDFYEREWIVRSLAVREAKGIAGQVLLDEFQKTPTDKETLRWAIGNSIEVIFMDDLLDQVIEIVLDKNNGMSMQMFVLSLGRSKTNRERVEEVLVSLLDDKEVTIHSFIALRKLKSMIDRNKINELLTSDNSYVRKEAKKALNRIDKQKRM